MKRKIKHCGIYRIQCGGYNYIGKSKDIDERIRQHIHNTYKPSDDFHAAMAALMWEWEILELCKPAKLNQAEQYWIATYNSYQRGWNKTMGGDTSYATSKRRVGPKQVWPKKK